MKLQSRQFSARFSDVRKFWLIRLLINLFSFFMNIFSYVTFQQSADEIVFESTIIA